MTFSSAMISGALRAWRSVVLDFEGPALGETPQTFRDYRLDVRFEHEGTGAALVAPGFFAADGAAAETGAAEGALWRVRFRAPMAGVWRWRARFRSGVGVAIENAAAVDFAGASAGAFDGASGAIKIAPPKMTPPDLRARGAASLRSGMLTFDQSGGSEAALIWAAPMLLHGGEFDGAQTRAAAMASDATAGGRDAWRPGDPDWGADGRGRSAVGAVRAARERGANILRLGPLLIDGASILSGPWRAGRGGASAGRLTFDVSRLEQWTILLHSAERLGAALLMAPGGRDASGAAMPLGALGLDRTERRLLLRELVARFGHLNGFMIEADAGVLGEEAGFLAELDPMRALISPKDASGAPALGAADQTRASGVDDVVQGLGAGEGAQAPAGPTQGAPAPVRFDGIEAIDAFFGGPRAIRFGALTTRALEALLNAAQGPSARAAPRRGRAVGDAPAQEAPSSEEAQSKETRAGTGERSAERDEGAAKRDEGAAKRDEGAAERDEGAAERDEGAAKRDQGARERDERSAERDKGAGERDESVAERDEGVAEREGGVGARDYVGETEHLDEIDEALAELRRAQKGGAAPRPATTRKGGVRAARRGGAPTHKALSGLRGGSERPGAEAEERKERDARAAVAGIGDADAATGALPFLSAGSVAVPRAGAASDPGRSVEAPSVLRPQRPARPPAAEEGEAAIGLALYVMDGGSASASATPLTLSQPIDLTALVESGAALVARFKGADAPSAKTARLSLYRGASETAKTERVAPFALFTGLARLAEEAERLAQAEDGAGAAWLQLEIFGSDQDRPVKVWRAPVAQPPAAPEEPGPQGPTREELAAEAMAQPAHLVRVELIDPELDRTIASFGPAGFETPIEASGRVLNVKVVIGGRAISALRARLFAPRTARLSSSQDRPTRIGSEATCHFYGCVFAPGRQEIEIVATTDSLAMERLLDAPDDEHEGVLLRARVRMALA